MLDRRHTLIRAAACLAVACFLAPAARAAAPAPLSNPAYGFPVPGSQPAAANAASAGLSLADRWLGDSPYSNPAAAPQKGVEISPLFQRINRQDLAATNRSTTQNRGYPDVAGGSVGAALGKWGVTLYAWQPVLRLEQLNYSSGPIATPAQIDQEALQREVRGGLAISRAFGDNMRFGLSGEYIYRSDSYTTIETSGSPFAGTRLLEFTGSGIGASAGFTYQKDIDQTWGNWFGAAVHYQQDMDLTGTLDEQLTAGDTQADIAVTRKAQISGGASARVTVAPATRIVLGVSGHTGDEWTEFGAKSDPGVAYSIGLDWKDSELPWGARFGVGQESNPGALEEKSGLLSAGFTWVSGDLVLDVGILHRNLARDGFAHSADDRLVGSVRFSF